MMQAQIRLTDNLAYLQRTGLEPAPLSVNLASTNAAQGGLRRLQRISGIGRLEKGTPPIPPRNPNQPVWLPTEDVIIGLYGYQIPLAFLVSGEPTDVAIHLGTWSAAERTSEAILNSGQSILSSMLTSLYSSVEFAPAERSMLRWPTAGLALGIPTAKPSDMLDGAVPLERLIRAMSDTHWACLVLAQPVVETTINQWANEVANEIRSVETAARAGMAPTPLAEHYTEMLKVELQALTQGQALGAWRTAVYLLGDGESYYRLASMWRGTFSGDQSLPEPVRVWKMPGISDLAVAWAMPNASAPSGPGHYQHPFQYQTVLTSSQLAAYVHLPQMETSGFSVKLVPNFDSVPQSADDGSRLTVGTVIQRQHPTQTAYTVDLDALTQHVFLAGVTGSGKTQTLIHLLKQADALSIPFLVVEPAKAEYRGLLYDPKLAGRLQIYTLGNETVSPFRLNPFEVVGWPTNAIGVHLDLLRSAFNASFGMWTPLPQVLEQCLHRVYQDRGWDIATNSNWRWDGQSDVAIAFPTLTDLVAVVDDVTEHLGYDDKVTSDIHAALLTRLNGLRAGGKGRMLDVQRSFPMASLLDNATVLELEGIGDDDDKAFLIGLLLIRLAEFRRYIGERHNLQHLIVVEEAHRLLANVETRGSEEQAAPRAKAVETFGNMLSEIRAYGQGVIVVDQVPTKLAPDVIKNTNLKIALRVVAEDDRKILAGAMAMDERQTLALATLERFQAAVYRTGDDSPILVQVPPPIAMPGQNLPDRIAVRDYMASNKIAASNRALIQPLLADVDMTIPESYMARVAAGQLAEDPPFRRDFVRFVISVVEDVDAFARLWDGFLIRAQASRSGKMEESILLRCLMINASEWFASRRGRQAGWTFADTDALRDQLRNMLLAALAGKGLPQAIKSFRATYLKLSGRHFEPFPGCDRICRQEHPVCLYRHAVADLISTETDYSMAQWLAASEPNDATKTWALSEAVAYKLIERDASRQAVVRIGLCYGQHMLAKEFPELHQVRLQELIDKANDSGSRGETNA